MTSAQTELVTTRRPTTVAFAGAGVLLSAITIVAGNYDVPAGENGGLSAGVGTAVICAVVAAILFGLVVPRVRHADRAVLVVGILTVVSLAIFWSGLTPILAGATLAAAATSPAPPRRTTVLRWVAVAAAVLTTVWALVNSHLA